MSRTSGNCCGLRTTVARIAALPVLLALLTGGLWLSEANDASAQGQKKSAKKHDHDHEHEHPELPKKAVCILQATEGNDVTGTLTLDEMEDHVHISGEVKGLTPGEHGFHIHMFGDLRAPDGASAGGHFDPHGHKHGGPDDEERHAGDLGNITADEDGTAKVDIEAKDLKLHFVIGRSLVVHAGKDDLTTQPSGDSGARIGVGVIGIAEEPKAESKSAKPAAKKKS
jgi:Cu-Zn family superoxide dismutase